MSRRKNSFYAIPGSWRSFWVLLFTGAFAAIIIFTPFSIFWKEPSGRKSIIILFAVWLAVFCIIVFSRFSKSEKSKKSYRWLEDLELGLLLVTGAYGVVQSAGGLNSDLYPIIFVLVTFLVVFMPLWLSLILLGTAISIELALAAFSPVITNSNTLITHVLFILFFAFINLLFTRTEMIRMRRRSDKSVAKAMAAMADEARDFRLITTAGENSLDTHSKKDVEQLARSSISHLKGAIYYHVDLLKRTMGLNTCAILWFDSNKSALRVREHISDTPNVVMDPFYKGEGIIGAVILNRKTLKLSGIRPDYKGLTYYATPAFVTDFIGIPIVDGGVIKGMLVGDRIDGREFTDEDVKIFNSSVESLLNIIFNERVFNQLQKTKSEQEKLLRASEMLSKNISENDVLCAALDAAMGIAAYETGVLTKITESAHVIRHSTGHGSEELTAGLEIEPSSLVISSIRNRHYLPNKGGYDPNRHILLSNECHHVFSKTRSALVLPLFSGDLPLGALILASSQAGLFDEEIRTTLKVMTNQLGTALKNAQMYQELEDLATTDGLTGLPNHRVFQEELSRRLASAIRNRNKLSVVFCDVDKFKGVNDTYGHPVGDMVLQGLSGILKKHLVRKTDMAARYGGEEFAIILEGTDTKGAVKFANRIRKNLEKEAFQTDSGILRVTISMGVSTYPDHAESKQELIERADTALYAAKESGRNRVCIYEDIP